MRSNRDRFLRWRRDLEAEEVNKIADSGYIWVVFDNEDGPIRCGKTAEEAMQGVTSTAYIGHVIDYQNLDGSKLDTAVFGIL